MDFVDWIRSMNSIVYEKPDGSMAEVRRYSVGQTVRLILSMSTIYEILSWKQIESSSAYDPPIVYKMVGGATWPHSCLCVNLDDF
jgi:hypothetical protein